MIAIISALAMSSLANAQEFAYFPLRIGDDAPAFKPISAAKGEYITSFQKGKTYVLEFWATWCGPCIAAMPHFSDLADKYKGRAEFYSVNTMNYVEKGVLESLDEHTKKINDWVAKNSDKMRYNSVLDDQQDTIYKSWVAAMGEAGVPVSLIVNDEGKVAWSGHPANVDKPLTAVLDKTWDIKAFRDEYEKRNEPNREAMIVMPKIDSIVRANDLGKLEACIEATKYKGGILYKTVQTYKSESPNLIANLLKKYEANTKLSAEEFSSFSRSVFPYVTDDALKSDMVKMSNTYLEKVPQDEMIGLTYVYQARALLDIGDKAGARKWLERAKTANAKNTLKIHKETIDMMIEYESKRLKE